ncbi:MAG: class I SAM-dependent methyltransferase [Acidobacteriota bacterium]
MSSPSNVPSSVPSNYVLGQSVHEYERLMLQSRILRPFTEKFFRAAGVGPGMRVLDVGSGMGDVALLAADIVGPAGRVLGIDRDATALENARRRTIEQGCSSWVSFQAAGLDEFTTTDQFDAIVGRYVLLYQPDAAATLRSLLRCVKPGGIVVFHDIDFPDPHSSYPPCQLWDQAYALLGEVFRKGGAPPDFGRRLGKTFLDAGLPFPTIAAENVVGGGRGSYVYAWIANTLVSVAPRVAQLGLEFPPGLVADDTLASRLEEAVVKLGSQVLAPGQFGAWTRKP